MRAPLGTSRVRWETRLSRLSGTNVTAKSGDVTIRPRSRTPRGVPAAAVCCSPFASTVQLAPEQNTRSSSPATLADDAPHTSLDQSLSPTFIRAPASWISLAALAQETLLVLSTNGSRLALTHYDIRGSSCLISSHTLLRRVL
ncbi:hypothetical protein PsYK624_017020 [Phanerochaete sordida]|uniref:Uncharacterized protein n=1 Tax=Phanerochaete sordida TaxID=48140 RepID=A0A9P3FYL0_9APHY|nr:hypothetical protein PsYK624_017020 [Phanerochaete sordida]